MNYRHQAATRLYRCRGGKRMNNAYRIALSVCALAAVALITGTQAQAKCSRAKAEGWGLDKMVAMEMAKMSLDTAVTMSGATAKGKVTYKCSAPAFTECTASRRVCSS
jgi:hypothetical protein